MRYTISFASTDDRRRFGPHCSCLPIEALETRRLLSAAMLPAGPFSPDGPGPGEAAINSPLHVASGPGVEAAAEAAAQSGNVFTPMNGTQFQQALNAAQLGDTIILQAGTTYTGWFTLPNKTTGTGWITIKSSAMEELPGEGVRVTPADAGNMPKIVSQGSNIAAIRTDAGAHHYRLIGLEIIAPANNSSLWNLIQLGTTGSAQSTLASVPHNIVIDRSIIRANSDTQPVVRGIALNSASTDILNSYIAGFKWQGADSQAIAGWNGPGPYNIINNYLEGAAENVMFGGADPNIPNLVPSDIVIRGNHFYKPLSWRIGHPEYAGTPWTIKNLFELKSARNVVVEGNIFEHNWTHAQVGYAILFTVRNQDGGAPWSVVENVDFINNIVRRSGQGFNILGQDTIHPSQQSNNIRIENNLFEDIGGPDWGSGNLFQVLNGTADLVINHNTAFHSRNIISFDGQAHTGFVFTNNIVPHNDWGVHGSGTGVGNSALNTFAPGAQFTANVIMGGNANSYNQYPGNHFPSNWGQVQFEDQAAGDYRLAPTSPYKDAGTTGKDIGADLDAVHYATRGAISGVWSEPVEVNSIEFHRQAAPHTVTVQFSNDVGANLGKEDFTVVNLATGVTVPQENWSLEYLAESNTAVLTFDGYPGGILPDGNYRLTVHAEGLMAEDGGTMADDHLFEFFFLRGDANGDGRVNVSDLSILSGNWQQSLYGPQFGDFNYDGVVNITDLSILAGNWQVDLNVLVVATAEAHELVESEPAGPAPVLPGPMKTESPEAAPAPVVQEPAPHPAAGRGPQQRAVVAPVWHDSRDPGPSLIGRNQPLGRSEGAYSSVRVLLEDDDIF